MVCDSGLKPANPDPAPFDLGLAKAETTVYIPLWLMAVRNLPLLALVALSIWKPNRRGRTLALGLAAGVVYSMVGIWAAQDSWPQTPWFFALQNLGGYFRSYWVALYQAGVVNWVALAEAFQLTVPALLAAVLAAPVYRARTGMARLGWIAGTYLAGGVIWGVLDSPYPDVVLGVRLGSFAVLSLWLILPAAGAVVAFLRLRGWKRFLLLVLCLAPLFAFAALGVEEEQPDSSYLAAALTAVCFLGGSLWLGAKARHGAARTWRILALQVFGIGMACALALLWGRRLDAAVACGIAVGLLLFAGHAMAMKVIDRRRTLPIS